MQNQKGKDDSKLQRHMAHATVTVTAAAAGAVGGWRRGKGNVGENCETDFSQFHFVLAVETVINLMKECVVHTFYLTRDEDDFRHLMMRGEL